VVSKVQFFIYESFGRRKTFAHKPRQRQLRVYPVIMTNNSPRENVCSAYLSIQPLTRRHLRPRLHRRWRSIGRNDPGSDMAVGGLSYNTRAIYSQPEEEAACLAFGIL